MLVLFINGRPVDCSPLKRALEATYAAILPKASKPWMFLVRRLLQCLLLHAHPGLVHALLVHIHSHTRRLTSTHAYIVWPILLYYTEPLLHAHPTSSMLLV